MKKTTLAALMFGFGALSVSCGPQEDATSDLHWGHLDKFDSKHPFFLINKKPGEVYRVCMARYMRDEIPGIEEELKAAVNIWGAYLGRSIPMVIEVKDLPRPTGTKVPATQGQEYYTACNEGKIQPMYWDLVVGLSPLSGSTVGLTGYWYSMKSNAVVSDYRRYLFLRDFKTAPELGDVKRWMSLEEVNQKPTVSPNILNTMLTRSTTKYAKTGSLIAFQVLVHEIGHVWGLCDQVTSGVDNCSSDNLWKSPHPDSNSIMAAASNVVKMYLTDDDITGIRKMATRTNYSSTWPGTEDDILRDPEDM
jgi:hypothetical protein